MLSVRLKGVFKKASEFFGRLISFFVKLVSSGMFILLLKSCFYQIIWSRPIESSDHDSIAQKGKFQPEFNNNKQPETAEARYS